MSRKVLESCLPHWNAAANRKSDKPRKFGQWIVAPRWSPSCQQSHTRDGWGQGPPEARGPRFSPGPGHRGDTAPPREQMTGGQDDLSPELWHFGLRRSLSPVRKGTL